ncbi:putative peroxisomal-coenzyme A synthetase [Mycena kentingensis (nom. inval.)]|nr:putative peroxisomal-coenzyme A synthetase [Mycena kentingensis (nom. inval.)]
MTATTLGDLLTIQPSQSPAIVLPSIRTLSYGEISAYVDALAAELDVSIGQSIAIVLPNSVEFLLAFFAAARLGAVACPLNPGYKEAEFEFYLNDTKPALVLVSAAPPQAAVDVAGKLGIPVKAFRFAELRPTNRVALSIHPSATALILHTSGTTGRPKAVPLSHANLLATARNIVETYALSMEDNTYLVQVLFHIHGIVAGLLAPLASGGAITLPAKLYPSKTWSEFKQCRCTWITAVPSILQILLRAPAPTDLRMRFIRSCSSPLAPSTLAALEERFCTPVLEAYAMTEAAHQMTSNPLPIADSPRGSWKRKPGSVGLPQGTEIAIYNGNFPVAAAGEHGDICIRSPSVTKGYIGNPEANADSFLPNGFFRTGDRGFLDADGFLTLVGRNSEIINRGGEKISPIEVDAALLACSAAILEAVCFAVPDELLGQEVEAVLVLANDAKLTEATIQDCLRRSLAEFKIPKRIHFVEGTIPKGPTGKIQRNKLTDLYGNRTPAVSTISPPIDLSKRIKSTLSNLLQVPVEQVRDEATLFELGADSIAFTRLVSSLRAYGLSVSLAALFANPSVGDLVRLVIPDDGTTSEPDPAPFSLLRTSEKEVAAQLGVAPEDVEDAFPLLRGQAAMYRTAEKAPDTAAWFVGHVVKLNDKVDVERWIEVWNSIYANEPCLRGTLIGRVESQGTEYAEKVNVAYLRPQARPPLWVKLRVDEPMGGRATIARYVAGLRHEIGMHSVRFVLASDSGGTLFALVYAHLFLDGGSREWLQSLASKLYLHPNTTALINGGCGPWARFAKHALSVEPAEAYWDRDLAPSRRLPAFHTARYPDENKDVSATKRHLFLDLPLAAMSQILGVSLPMLAESASCLAISLYWSQIGSRMEPAFYAKSTSYMYEQVRDVLDIRGLLFQPSTTLVSVATANLSLWSFIQAVMHKARAVEKLEQTVEQMQPKTAITWAWRIFSPNAEWEALTTPVDSAWRPVCPLEITMARIAAKGKQLLLVHQMQQEWFADEFVGRGCKLELIEVVKRVLVFFAENSAWLEEKTYEDLERAVWAR